MTIQRYLLTAAAAIAFSGSAQAAECQLNQFELGSGIVNSSYDPFDATSNPIQLEIRSSGSPDCANQRVRVSVEPDLSAPTAINGGEITLTSGSDRLVAQLSGANGRAARDTFASGAPTSILRLGSTGEARSSELALILAAGQRVPPGLYTTRLKVVATPVSDTGRDGRSYTGYADIAIQVKPSVGLAAGSGTTIDLGTIEDNDIAQEAVTFRAYGNTGYELAFSSDNDFKLVLNGTAGGPSIKYVPVLGNKELEDTSSPVAFSEPGNKGFREHRLNVRVPELKRRPAGTYRDYITVKISAVVAG